MKEKSITLSGERDAYVPANINVIEISARNVICQSGGMYEDDYGGGGFTQD